MAGLVCCSLASGPCRNAPTHLIYDPADPAGTFVHACPDHAAQLTGVGEVAALIADVGDRPPSPVDAALYRLARLGTGGAEVSQPTIVQAP